ncbi:hypothetical protein DX130_16970 [Paenibacillus paeoniae]|uniref:Uncharacterized protein n=2 Tax=Paenibacillus paeoniae TaxID=2292705 RepID=A0A371PE86_9BACL|nr:hypothetical protein DX130_16970 [Paenibacillus paeoniae]
MKDGLWQLIQEMKGDQLQLADLQVAASPSFMQKFGSMFDNRDHSKVMKIIEPMKGGEWPM